MNAHRRRRKKNTAQACRVKKRTRRVVVESKNGPLGKVCPKCGKSLSLCICV